jgi:alkanesulfonate monooxygenase SsuD/methylene tetrahydromethanopterin reductase-like flavin-dependent oxidoreductase (luciferase family)
MPPNSSTGDVPNRVRFGLKLPNCGGVLCPPEWADPATIDRLAAVAVDAGFDSLWLHDHQVVPAELSHLEAPNFFEPLITAAHLATLFPTVEVGVATVILPLREPLLLTKQITTLGGFFPGRIIAGLGIGRYESEFVAAGQDLFRVRGKVSDENLEIMAALLDNERTSYRGQWRSLDGAIMHPKRAGIADPAIWVAGNSGAGVRRAARFADGWIAAAVSPHELADLSAGIRESRPTDRDGPFVVALSATVRRSEGRLQSDSGEQLHTHPSAIVGDVEEVVSGLADYADAGVGHFLLSLGLGPLERTVEDISWFGSRVIPRIRRAPNRALASHA